MTSYIKPLIVAGLLTIATHSSAWDLGPVGKFEFKDMGSQVFVMHGPLAEPNKDNHGFMNNPAFIESKNGLIVVDPGGTYPVGKEVLKEIKKISQKPVIAVLNTHIHGDHWLANQAIKEAYPEAKIYAHPKMIAQASGDEGLTWIDLMDRLTEGLSKGTKIVPPTIPVKHGDKITIDGNDFIIHHFDRAHTDTDIVIEHKQSQTIFLGDNGFKDRFGRFDGSAHTLGNIKALETAKNLNGRLYVPGHGQSGNFNESTKPFLDYLVKLRQLVKQGYEEELEDYEIKDKIIAQFNSYKDWHGFDVNFGKHINKMYLEIEEE